MTKASSIPSFDKLATIIILIFPTFVTTLSAEKSVGITIYFLKSVGESVG